MPEAYLVHELVWLQADIATRLPGWFAGLPAWAQGRVHAAHPLVVRRAEVAPGWVAVGLRGHSRAERHGTAVPQAAIVRRVRPAALRMHASRAGRGTLPALQAWDALRDRLSLSFDWGPAGSVAYELATGADTVSVGSDLDMVLYAPEPLTREAARQLLAAFELPACHCDVQLILPDDRGLALREWARGDAHVLVKTRRGPQLTDQPWTMETPS